MKHAHPPFRPREFRVICFVIASISFINCSWGQSNGQTARARVEEKSDTIRVWLQSKQSGGAVNAGALLRDGDQVTVFGSAKLTWLAGGTISFDNTRTYALFDIGLAAGSEDLQTRFAPIFLRQLSGVMDVSIPASTSPAQKFELATHTLSLSTNGARFRVEINERGRATIVRVEEGQVDLTPANTRLKPVIVHAREEVEVNKVAVISNKTSVLTTEGSGPAQASYFIFILDLYNYEELYLGTEASLRDRNRCSFGGGGHCLPEERVSYQKLLGPFATDNDARAALCENVNDRQVFGDSVRKGFWQPTGTWYAIEHESVSFACPKPAASKVNPLLMIVGIVVAVGLVGFLFYRVRVASQPRKKAKAN